MHSTTPLAWAQPHICSAGASAGRGAWPPTSSGLLSLRPLALACQVCVVSRITGTPYSKWSVYKLCSSHECRPLALQAMAQALRVAGNVYHQPQ